MNSQENYYNGFYKELSLMDESGNDFRKIKDMLPNLVGDESFLDIGCGHGSVSHELIKNGFDVYGVEVNDDAINSLEDKGFKIFKRDITKPLNIDIKFNIVMLLDVLEHVFDPLSLLQEAKNITKFDNQNPWRGGYIIATVPLYFDFVDRFKILFTGSIISMDNLCYGIDNYRKFRSYNYDHIRFFRPKEVFEMGRELGLEVDKVRYMPTAWGGNNFFLKNIIRLISNKYTVDFNPNLLAHSMKIRWKV